MEGTNQEDHLDLLAFGFGFSGASIKDLEHLAETSQVRDVVFFGLDQELHRKFGSSNPGAASHVRRNTVGMMPWTQLHGAVCHDIGILNATDPTKAMQDLVAVNHHISQLDRRPVLIACDHTASLIAALGTTRHCSRKPAYLYFDAHFDLGLHNPSPETHNGNFVNMLRTTQWIDRIINLGGRSWTSYSSEYACVPGFTSIPGGVHRCSLAATIQQLADLKNTPVYVSIDADVLDPSFAPNVSCPEPFGMPLEDLFAICEWIGTSCEVLGADLCEIIPTDQSIGTEQALMRCIHALFPRQRPSA